MNFISSSCLIALARTSNILFSKSAKSGHPYLVLVLTGMTFCFSLWRVLPVSLSQMSYYVELLSIHTLSKGNIVIDLNTVFSVTQKENCHTSVLTD